MRVKFAILSAAAAATGISLYFLYKRFSSSSRRRDPALNEAIDLFISTYLHKPTHAASAPGRVNLIGEHTDYNDGFVMPCALELRTFIVGSVNHQQRVIRIVSSNMKDNVVEIPLEDLEKKSEEKNWWDYIRGVLAIYQAKSKAKIPGLNLAIVGKVPLGSGLSSSAAVEVATATFLEGLFGLDSSKEEIALIAQKAEHEYAGCPCGIMDQFISAMGKQGNALLLDCRTRIPKYIPLSNPDFVVLVTNTNVKHELNNGEYAVRKNQCKEAVTHLQNENPAIQQLRDATLNDLLNIESKLDPVVYKRAVHVVGENSRTEQFAHLLSQGDYISAGRLMYQSHKSLKDDYEVSCPELDFMVEAFSKMDGVIGARMTGGGFGGSTVALVKKSKVNDVIEQIKKQYFEKFNIEATCLVTAASDGARIERL